MITYSDGLTPIRVGDQVEVTTRRFIFFESKKNGEINYVYDPSKPIEREKNDVGVGIKIGMKNESWWHIDLRNNQISPQVKKISHE